MKSDATSWFKRLPFAALVASLCLLLLVGCGGPRKVLGPPNLSVQEIETIDGRYVARLRVDSPASMPVTLARFDWRLSIAGVAAASGAQALSQTLPPVSGDVVRIDLGDVASLPALAGITTDSSVAYVLEGELQCSEPKVRFTLRYDGRLRATPGKPGSFR